MKEILSKLIKFKGTKAPRSKEQCGLDIGTYSVKACVIKTENDKKEIISYANVVIENSDIKNSIKKALEMVKWEAKAVNISSGVAGVVTRQIVFPKMTQDELKEALKFEAEKHIPYKIDEVILDSQILKQDVEPNKMLLLLAAAKKDIIEKRIALAKEIDFKIEVIDVDSLSLINAFNFLYAQEAQQQKSAALIHMGNSVTSVVILKNGLPYVIRDFFIAGKDLNKRIIDALGVETAEADNLKINPGQKQNEVSAACESVLNEACSQIRMSFDYFENQHAVPVEKIYLSGGTSRFVGLDELFENYFGIKVAYWDKHSDIKLSSDIDEKKFLTEIGVLNVSLGLALR